jgi:ankyrin repeat protein
MTSDNDPLREAIEAGDLAAARRLLAADPGRLREPLRPGENPSFRPMTVAAVNCQTAILAFLIEEGGDVMEHSNFPLCRAATRGGCVPTMELLVDQGADVDQVCQDYGPPLIYAIEGGSQDSAEFLLSRDARIASSGPGSDGDITWDALKHAGHFSRKNPWMLPLLLNSGADVNCDIIDQQGGKSHNSALHNVAAKGDLNGIRLLLEHGADPKAVNNDGKLPTEVASSRKASELLRSAVAER